MIERKDYNVRAVLTGDITPAMLALMVESYQKENGLIADGQCGPKTMAHLMSRVLRRAAPPDSNMPLRLRALEFARREIGRGEDPSLGNNRGEVLDEYRETAGLPVGGGDAWCAAFICAMFVKASLSGKAPFEVSTGAKRLVRNVAVAGLETINPEPGAVICWHRGIAVDWRGHVGLIESYNAESDLLVTIEGNKNLRGQSIAKVERFSYPAGSWRERLYKIALI